MQEEVFSKILSGSASDKEKTDFYLSLEKDESLRELFYHYKNIYILSSSKTTNYDRIRKKSFAGFWRRTHLLDSRRMMPEWLRYAAVFMLALCAGSLAHYLIFEKGRTQVLSQHIEYSSGTGSISTVQLDDGSQIWLSSGTRLSIDKGIDEKMVAHLNGEAYFDLIPNSSRNFIVDLGYIKVRDIGTRFNIRAYAEERSVYATLVRGQIDLLKNTGISLCSMKPGDYLQFDKKSRRITVSQKDTSITTAWKDGKFVFMDKTLADICKELGNWYDVQIQIESQHLANTRYTCIVRRTTTIDQVLDLLSITDHIHYKIINKKEGKNLITIRR